MMPYLLISAIVADFRISTELPKYNIFQDNKELFDYLFVILKIQTVAIWTILFDYYETLKIAMRWIAYYNRIFFHAIF